MVSDTGASTDILDENTFSKIKQLKNIKLQTPTKYIFAYGSNSQLTVPGKFATEVEFKNNRCTSHIHVLQGNHGSLLRYKTASNLGIIDVNLHRIDEQSFTSEMSVQQYPNVFKGIGQLKNVEIKLHINETVVIVPAQSGRRIPFHMRKKVSKELENLEQQGIIEKVKGPTPWVFPLVIIPKKKW